VKISDSYRRIWAVVKKIPRGRVSTYGEIARLSGLPGQARLAGYAMFNLPEGASVPWHRVVNAKGMVSIPPRRASSARQRKLLEAEGVVFRGGRIDLAKHLWPRRAAR
jgi:methylated-DNA-protein-cysteine methyltransferase-like protein